MGVLGFGRGGEFDIHVGRWRGNMGEREEMAMIVDYTRGLKKSSGVLRNTWVIGDDVFVASWD